MKKFPPGSTIGILGSGQLGRMFTEAAHRLGYKVHTYSPDSSSPTGQIAEKEVVGSYDDLAALRNFAAEVDLITFEFENVSSASAKALEEIVPVRPSGDTLLTFQHRLREKEFLQKNNIPVAPFAAINSNEQLRVATDKIGFPAILKTAGFGYDGKGQTRLKCSEDLTQFTDAELASGYVLEKFIPFDREVSIIAARDEAGNFLAYPLSDNVHTNHILDYSVIPANNSAKLQPKAEQIARTIFEALNVIGVMCVEFFVVGDELLVNEVAPRTHNSGHHTIEAAITSQFEQQLRAVTGIGLGETTLKSQAAMVNILGDIYRDGKLNLEAIERFPNTTLHLYGKAEARAGRKMGHITAVGKDSEECLKRTLALRDALSR